MDAPTTSFAVAAIVVLALPGFIYAAIRRWAGGENSDDRNIGALFARGLVFTVWLSAIYFSWAADPLSPASRLTPSPIRYSSPIPRQVAGLVLVLFVVVPALLSLVAVRRDIAWERRVRPRWLRWVWLPRSSHHYVGTPTSWDHAVRKHTDDPEKGTWVKIRRADNVWVGGWFTKGSHVTMYPEPESIYIDEQFEMTVEGGFGDPIPWSRGMGQDCPDRHRGLGKAKGDPMSDADAVDRNRGETDQHERVTERGVEPAKYVPAPTPPNPVKDSGIGGSSGGAGGGESGGGTE